MINEFVKFETARLAREKGFDIPLKAIYNDSGELTQAHYASARNRDVEYGMSCTAPTQSLLQRWLREVHDIHIWVELVDHDRHYSYWLVSDFVNEDAEDDLYWDTYEEAMEVGLVEALKLIVI